LEGQKNHDTVEHVKENIRNPIPYRIEFPEMVINAITQNPYWLIGCSSFWGEDALNILYAQTPDFTIGINHSIIPVSEKVAARIQIKTSNKRCQKTKYKDL
jgi:hypothetical protein